MCRGSLLISMNCPWGWCRRISSGCTEFGLISQHWMFVSSLSNLQVLLQNILTQAMQINSDYIHTLDVDCRYIIYNLRSIAKFPFKFLSRRILDRTVWLGMIATTGISRAQCRRTSLNHLIAAAPKWWGISATSLEIRDLQDLHLICSLIIMWNTQKWQLHSQDLE